MKTMKITMLNPLLPLLLLASSQGLATGADGSGGGAARELFESRIRWTAEELARHLETNESLRAQVGLTKRQVAEIRAAVERTPEIQVEKDLHLRIDLNDKDCVFDRNVPSITCDLDGISLLNQGTFLGLVSHEVFGLAGLEHTLDYRYSRQLMNAVGPMGLAALSPQPSADAAPAWDRTVLSQNSGRPISVKNGDEENSLFPSIRGNASLRLVASAESTDASCKGVIVVGYVPKHGNPVPEVQVIRLKGGSTQLLDSIVPSAEKARRIDIRALTSCPITLDVFNEGTYKVRKYFSPNPNAHFLLGNGHFEGAGVTEFVRGPEDSIKALVL